MSKVYAIIRGVNEKSFGRCEDLVKAFGYDYIIFRNDSSLEDKSKASILIGSMLDKNKYEWVWVIDADIEISAAPVFIEEYCDMMKENYKDTLFCFTGYLDCTKRGLIDGTHFFRTKHCKTAYDIIKNVDFSFHMGRQEYEICQLLKEKHNLPWRVGDKRLSMGLHLFEENNQVQTFVNDNIKF